MRKREINAICDRIEKYIDSVFGNDSIFALNAQKEEQKETQEQIHAGLMISIPENLKKDNQEKKVSDAEISEKKKEKAIIMDYFYQKAKKGKDELMKMTGKRIPSGKQAEAICFGSAIIAAGSASPSRRP